MPRLSQYRAKRKLDQSLEPRPKIPPTSSHHLRFCVQKHKARRLHYDFRLELDGVLVSWAVPKGPSMNPADKRLAIHVEDHPLDYIDFEGVIPAGNYGAGQVLIWDQGTYTADIKEMRTGLAEGHLHFELKGKKLKGTFALVKMKNREDNAWLLFKVLDDSKKKTNMPSWVSPMLATLIDKPFDSTDWLYEIKWDGYRALAVLNKTKVQLWSRNHQSLNNDYPSLVNELKKLNTKAILDGEIVVLDRQGISRFELLQGCKKDPHCHPHYMIFDLLYLDGFDLRSRPLVTRKNLLADLLSRQTSDILHYGDHVEEMGIQLFKEAQSNGLEGLIAKRKDSSYVSHRSMDWQKIKTKLQQEFVIGGFTEPRGHREYFGSLLLGLFSEGEFQFVGRVGVGFDEILMKNLFKKMTALIRKTCPFSKIPKTNMKATWLKPVLIAEISFAEWTARGLLRQPVFLGLRTDKLAADVEPEPRFLVENNLSVSLSNLDKVFWPQDGYTKRDMLHYYEAISPFILPHLKGRPLMLRRFPDGIAGIEFYQKNIDHPPSWLKTAVVEHTHKSDGKEDHYAIVDNLKSLLYVANLAAIEIHPMLARVGHLDRPDFIVMDLDPEAVSFKKVVEVAQVAHAILDAIGLPNYCKTSGARGLHIYIPLDGNVSFDQGLYLAQILAHSVKEQLPSLVSLERMPKNRQRRVYVDYLQNSQGKNMVAPYSLRAHNGASVSTPLQWHEVKDHLDPLDFNILSIPARVKKIGDVFAPVLKKGIALKTILKRLEKYI